MAHKQNQSLSKQIHRSAPCAYHFNDRVDRDEALVQIRDLCIRKCDQQDAAHCLALLWCRPTREGALEKGILRFDNPPSRSSKHRRLRVYDAYVAIRGSQNPDHDILRQFFALFVLYEAQKWERDAFSESFAYAKVAKSRGYTAAREASYAVLGIPDLEISATKLDARWISIFAKFPHGLGLFMIVWVRCKDQWTRIADNTAQMLIRHCLTSDYQLQEEAEASQVRVWLLLKEMFGIFELDALELTTGSHIFSPSGGFFDEKAFQKAAMAKQERELIQLIRHFPGQQVSFDVIWHGFMSKARTSPSGDRVEITPSMYGVADWYGCFAQHKVLEETLHRLQERGYIDRDDWGVIRVLKDCPYAHHPQHSLYVQQTFAVVHHAFPSHEMEFDYKDLLSKSCTNFMEQLIDADPLLDGNTYKMLIRSLPRKVCNRNHVWQARKILAIFATLSCACEEMIRAYCKSFLDLTKVSQTTNSLGMAVEIGLFYCDYVAFAHDHSSCQNEAETALQSWANEYPGAVDILIEKYGGIEELQMAANHSI